MTDFGEKLRQARERRGVSLRQIAENTKISVAALEALERDDVSRLPGGIFSRAFVRSYAVEVGLDPDETVRAFLARFPHEPAAPVADAALMARKISEEESAFESRQRMASVLLKIIIASVVAVAVILYLTWRQPPASPRSAPVDQPPAAEHTPRAHQVQWIPASDRL